MEISDLDPSDAVARERCAQLLVDEFREIAPDAWPVIEKARETLDECMTSGPVRVARVDDTIVGWIGGRHTFSRVWELHPLV
ncbi:MAG: N-acetyltransferase, partial [Polyangiales bacterium]